MEHPIRIARPVQSSCPRPTRRDADWWALQNGARPEAPAKGKGQAEVETTALLVLMIKGTPYAVSFVPAPALGPSARAVRLTRADGTHYHVVGDFRSPSCECGDFLWRRDGLYPLGCKHIRAGRAAGLIP